MTEQKPLAADMSATRAPAPTTQGVLRSRVVWWICIAISLVGIAIAAPYADTLQNTWFAIPEAAYLLVGAVVSWRRPRSPVGWVLLSVGVMTGVLGAANTWAQQAFDDYVPGVPVSAWGLLGAWISNWVWYVVLYAMTVLMFLLYPDGLPSPRWRPFLLGSACLVAVVSVMASLGPTLVIGDNVGGRHSMVVPNPVSPLRSAEAAELSSLFSALSTVLFLVMIVVSIVSLFVRRRHATQVERLQLRWFAFAAVIFLITMLLQPFMPGGDAGTPANLSFSLAVAAIPIACGVAILRYRLYDIDRIVSRTVTYAVVTASVVGVYSLVVASASLLLPDGVPSWVVAAATLAAAALVRPLLRRVQRVVDRRFNRQKVDAQRAVEEYGSQLVDEVDPSRAGRELVRVAHQVMAPSAVGLWTTGGGS